MLLQTILLIVSLQLLLLPYAAPAVAVSECERRMHSSFTAQQKQQLCAPVPPTDTSAAAATSPTSKSSTTSRSSTAAKQTTSSAVKTSAATAAAAVASIGPAICAAVAKDSLHAKFDVILQLCQGALSASPAQCMSQLDSAARSRYGLLLCSRANSTLPGDCFAEVSKFGGSNNRIKPEELVGFCSNLVDRAPLQCLHAVRNTSLLPLHRALGVCNDSVGNGFTSHFFLNNAVSSCIQKMHKHVNPSFGTTAEEVLRFCAATNYLPDLKGNSAAADVQRITLTESADCYESSAQLRAAASQSTAATATSTAAATATTGPVLLSEKQRLSLCENAPTAAGPVDCAAAAVAAAAATRNDPGVRLKSDDVVALCRGAVSGSGAAKCFAESKGLGSVDLRTHLCNGASNAGPAQCYRRAGAVFKSTTAATTTTTAAAVGDVIGGNRTLLCVSAETEDPAYCAAEAPHYLSVHEKVELCAHTPSMAGKGAVRCLSAAENVYRQFHSAPPKSLGYFLGNLWEPQEKHSRSLLLQMCSYGGSQDPLAAAECLKSAPKSLELDDAVRMCRNISSANVIAHMQLCHRILPRPWQSEEAALLCEHTVSRPQVEAAVKCALDAVRISSNFLGSSSSGSSSSNGISSSGSITTTTSSTSSSGDQQQQQQLLRRNAALLCAQEQAHGPVLACINEIAKIPLSAPGSYLLTPQSATAVCSSASSSAPGVCLRQLAAISSSKLSFTADVPAHLCSSSSSIIDSDSTSSGSNSGNSGSSSSSGEVAAVIACLEQQSKRLISSEDVDRCVHSEQQIKSVRLLRITTEDNDVEITAGRRFSVHFQLLDQWGRAFKDQLREYMFSAALNSNNAQGAVLWGLRSNYSTAAAAATTASSNSRSNSRGGATAGAGVGVLELNSLIISQPGPVEFRISARRFPTVVAAAAAAAASSSQQQQSSGEALQLLETFRLTVKEDPMVKETAPCVFVFHQAQCPAGTAAADWEAEFPRTRSYSPASTAIDITTAATATATSSTAASTTGDKSTATSSTTAIGSRSVNRGGGGIGYLRNIQCAGDVLQSLHVNAYLLPGGDMWVEYRLGVDSIWTGIGMPKMEQSPEERLGLFDDSYHSKATTTAATAAITDDSSSSSSSSSKKSNKKGSSGNSSKKQERLAQKELRRAYYRKSLQWHPDRWAGMSMYSLAVQGAFELIHEAYEQLTASDASSNSSGDSSSDGGSSATIVNVYE